MSVLFTREDHRFASFESVEKFAACGVVPAKLAFRACNSPSVFGLFLSAPARVQFRVRFSRLVCYRVCYRTNKHEFDPIKKVRSRIVDSFTANRVLKRRNVISNVTKFSSSSFPFQRELWRAHFVIIREIIEKKNFQIFKFFKFVSLRVFCLLSFVFEFYG